MLYAIGFGLFVLAACAQGNKTDAEIQDEHDQLLVDLIQARHSGCTIPWRE